MFKLGIADMVVPPSWEAITIGCCCVTEAFVAWKAGPDY